MSIKHHKVITHNHHNLQAYIANHYRLSQHLFHTNISIMRFILRWLLVIFLLHPLIISFKQMLWCIICTRPMSLTSTLIALANLLLERILPQWAWLSLIILISLVFIMNLERSVVASTSTTLMVNSTATSTSTPSKVARLRKIMCFRHRCRTNQTCIVVPYKQLVVLLI